MGSVPRQAIRLEQFSVIWMIVEAGAAVTTGIICQVTGADQFRV